MTITHRARSAAASFHVTCAHRAGGAGLDDAMMARLIFGGIAVALLLLAAVLGPCDFDGQQLSP